MHENQHLLFIASGVNFIIIYKNADFKQVSKICNFLVFLVYFLRKPAI